MKNNETKSFSARTLLTVTTGLLLTKGKKPGDNGIGDLYEVLGWMTKDDDIYTHQLGRVSKECTPHLLKWFPELEVAGSPKNLARLSELADNEKARGEPYESALCMWLKWMAEPATAGLKQKYDVPRIPAAAHKDINPLLELQQMANGKSVIAINVDR